MKKNIKHWYDGWIYDNTIANFQMKLFKSIEKFIPENSNMIDVACATGKFPLYLAQHCKYIIGVDLSQKNIKIAKSKQTKYKINNIEFIHGNATNLIDYVNNKVDVASISLAIHEMPENIRLKVLQNIIDVSNTMIIADYTVPQTKNFYGKFNSIVEYFAGRKHFRNFKNFCELGGIPYYLNKLQINKYISFKIYKENLEIFIIQNS